MDMYVFFGSIAGATASFVGGILFLQNPESIFWAASISGAILCVLLYLAPVKKRCYRENEN